MISSIYQIALSTYRESVRGKVLYSLLFFGAVVVLISALFGAVTIGDQVKVIEDFGLMSMSLFAVALAVISGAALLHKELNRKTIYNILAKPVRRWEFLVGKHLGLLLTVGVMLLLMAIGLVLFVYVVGGELNLLLFQAALYIFIELIIVTAAAIFFSSIVITPALSGLFTFSIFLAGRSSEYVLQLVEAIQVPQSKKILEYLYWALPHLDKLNISDQVVYGHGATFAQLGYSTLYAVGYAGVLLALASFFFSRRDFN